MICLLIQKGEDGENLSLQKVHSACWLVHAKGNQMSPFEFEYLSDAEAFIQMIWGS